jgi:outer membrane receptor protein involved in Fe transport
VLIRSSTAVRRVALPLLPASVLTGDALARSRAGTLGDTLSGLPGVAATGFGAQSSRPVIRGLDGDRIRLLDNGGDPAPVDASSLSFDHAVAIDPLVVERFEVLRGPAALLYGGNATGGVVNAIDNRIPRGAARRDWARAELRLGGAARESAAAAVLEAGAGAGLNWHADVAAARAATCACPDSRRCPTACRHCDDRPRAQLGRRAMPAPWARPGPTRRAMWVWRWTPIATTTASPSSPT